jgi:Mn2+/Fe2+ NRAMP family transporter
MRRGTTDKMAETFSFRTGFVSAAADNDPTTVGTIAVIGATTVYGLAWLVVLLLPMLAVIQAIAASVGGARRTGLQGAIRTAYGLPCAVIVLLSVVIINVVTLAADIKAGSEGFALLSGLQYRFFVLPFVALVCLLLVTSSMRRITRILSYVSVLFICYAACAFCVRVNWWDVVGHIMVPHFEFSAKFVGGALALIGTTLTSYVYYWESIEVAERHAPPALLPRMKTDAALGMLITGTSFLFVLIATGATLGAHHVNVANPGDVAAAINPIAGPWAQLLFGIGLLASAAIAAPVIAGTTGYVVAQTFGWRGSLNMPPRQAKVFYAVIVTAVVFAGACSFTQLPTIALLYWASILGGIATPLTLTFVILIARNPVMMGMQTIGKRLEYAAWGVTGFAWLASASFIVLALTRSGALPS